MKVFLKSKLHLVSYLSLFIVTSMVADSGGEYLSEYKKEILKIEKEINKKSATNLKYDWINPIVASYSYSKSDQIGRYSKSKYFRISFDQPVFKSGGIYFAILYSNANKTFKEIVQNIKEANLVKSLYDGVLNLKKIDLQIKKAELSISNAKIDIQRKREQFESGLIDSSFLNSAILSKTKLQHQLLDLKTLKFSTLNSFKNISDIEYTKIKLPHFQSIDKEEFVKKNLDISQKTKERDQTKELKNMTISNYLPTVSLFGNYNYKDDELQFFKQAKEYKSYGINISMPLFAINRSRDIEIKKLEYLKSKIALKDQQKASINEFLTIENSIEILLQKIEISKSDILLYDSLVLSAKDGLIAGEKTILDVKTLENSKQIAKLDAEIYDIQRVLELLKLYTKMSDEI